MKIKWVNVNSVTFSSFDLLKYGLTITDIKPYLSFPPPVSCVIRQSWNFRNYNDKEWQNLFSNLLNFTANPL